MPEFTPGPLIVMDNEEGWIVDTPHERFDADGALAYVARHADALLYAASPALYEACKAALAFYEWHMAAVPSEVLGELPQRRAALQAQLRGAISLVEQSGPDDIIARTRLTPPTPMDEL